MGLEVAKVLARKGANVVIVARGVEKLEKAMKEVEAEAVEGSGQKFKWCSGDLSVAGEVERVFAEVVEWGGVPDIVWTCAGAAHPGLFTEITSEILESQMRTNYFSAMHTAHSALRLMTSSPLPAGAPQRHLVFTASVLAFIPLAGYNPYTPAKAALRALADGLRQECLLYGIDVHCCFPATIYTPGYEFEQSVKPSLTKKLEEGDSGQTPVEVARVCVGKLEKGQSNVTTSLVGEALRATAWGGSRRGNVVVDTVWIWIVAVVWLIVGWDMERTVRRWGRENGYAGSKKD